MTIVVTRNAPGRVRGFLASCMCEVAPGVYTGPSMTAGIRERVWSVLLDWYEPQHDRSIVMTWPDSAKPGGQDFRFLGAPRHELVEHHGVFIARREVPEDVLACLTTAVGPVALPEHQDALVVDVETTGLDEEAEVIAIAAVSMDGRVVLDLRCRPEGKMDPKALRVHRLDARALRNAPTFPSIHKELESALKGKRLFAWNASFDQRALEQTQRRHRLPELSLEWACLLERYEAWKGIRCSLAAACELENTTNRPTHSALDDARAALGVLRRMGGRDPLDDL